MIGFAAGLMYVIQAYRLKHKLPPKGKLRLPSLEWLQRFNRECLYVSAVLLLLGLLAGVVLKFNREAASVGWMDPLVLWSAVLFSWLVGVGAFEYAYRPAREGHKVVYLTLASGILLVVAMAIVLIYGHAGADTSKSEADAAWAGVFSPVMGVCFLVLGRPMFAFSARICGGERR